MTLRLQVGQQSLELHALAPSLRGIQGASEGDLYQPLVDIPHLQLLEHNFRLSQD